MARSLMLNDAEWAAVREALELLSNTAPSDGKADTFSAGVQLLGRMVNADDAGHKTGFFCTCCAAPMPPDAAGLCAECGFARCKPGVKKLCQGRDNGPRYPRGTLR